MCSNFNLCDRCEYKGRHPMHNMSRIVRHDAAAVEDGAEPVFSAEGQSWFHVGGGRNVRVDNLDK